MKFIDNLSIKFKLGALFFILLLSVTTIGYKTISMSQNNKEILEVVHSKSQTVLTMQEEIIAPLYRLKELSQFLVMAPNNKIRSSIEKKLLELTHHLNTSFQRLLPHNQKIFEMWTNYQALIDITRYYLASEFEEGAYINTTTASRDQFNLLIRELLTTQSKALGKAKTAYEDAALQAKNIKIEIFSSLFFILLFALILGSLILSNIINSIQTVQNGLKEFFEYLNNQREKAGNIKLTSNDEFSEMAKMINENVRLIQNKIKKDEALIKDATNVLKNIKCGNLGNRMSATTTNSNILNELKNMINNMIDNLENKIQEEIAKRLEQEQLLIQQSKLASMGEMIGNIAHQWRQPLAEIAAIFMNIKVTSDFNKITQEYLNQKIKEANKLTQYMSQTITDFQNFFKPHGEKEIFSVETACKEALFIIASSLSYHNIKVNFSVLDTLAIKGYKNEYSQVILNLLNNAKNILLERDIKNPFINIEIKSGENFAIVKIEDNGGGIEKSIMDKIFEPYFTTRHKTQGTGIGLYMSKNIIEKNMNGYVNVKNTDLGACFIVKVPKQPTEQL